MEKIPVRTIKNSIFSSSFAIREIGSLLSEYDMVQPIHRHDFFFVLVLQKGQGEHMIDFHSYPINDYSIFFMRPGQVHQLTLKKGSDGYLLSFKKNFCWSTRESSAYQTLRKVSNKNHYQLNDKHFKKVHSILFNISQEYTEKQEKYIEVIQASLEIFFIELLRQSQDPKKKSKNTMTYSQERFEDLIELLETHFLREKQVGAYADMLHLTTYQLNAITKEAVGKTCSQLINEHIILEAKRNLLLSANQVNQIAFYLGYKDPSYFIRFFKKNTGYSPEAFRQNFK